MAKQQGRQLGEQPKARSKEQVKNSIEEVEMQRDEDGSYSKCKKIAGIGRPYSGQHAGGG